MSEYYGAAVTNQVRFDWKKLIELFDRIETYSDITIIPHYLPNAGKNLFPADQRRVLPRALTHLPIEAILSGWVDTIQFAFDQGWRDEIEVLNEETDEYEDRDLLELLGPCLLEGEKLIVKDVGFEGYGFIHGQGFCVDHTGKVMHVDLEDTIRAAFDADYATF